jgi:hypothetical protein
MRSFNARSLVSLSLITSFLSSCVYGQLTIQTDSQGPAPSFCIEKLETDVSSVDSLKTAAKSAADAIMSMYVGNQPGQVPGIFLPVDVYYWWLGGANWNVQPSLDPY